MDNFRNKKAFGDWGETVAATYLTKRGYQIISTNYRCPYGEVDLICKKDSVWCFVEVKTRQRESSYGSGYYAVTPLKQQRLIKTALHFVSIRGLGDVKLRFDVISIDYLSGKDYRISFFKNAFGE